MSGILGLARHQLYPRLWPPTAQLPPYHGVTTACPGVQWTAAFPLLMGPGPECAYRRGAQRFDSMNNTHLSAVNAQRFMQVAFAVVADSLLGTPTFAYFFDDDKQADMAAGYLRARYGPDGPRMDAVLDKSLRSWIGHRSTFNREHQMRLKWCLADPLGLGWLMLCTERTARDIVHKMAHTKALEAAGGGGDEAQPSGQRRRRRNTAGAAATAPPNNPEQQRQGMAAQGELARALSGSGEGVGEEESPPSAAQLPLPEDAAQRQAPGAQAAAPAESEEDRQRRVNLATAFNAGLLWEQTYGAMLKDLQAEDGVDWIPGENHHMDVMFAQLMEEEEAEAEGVDEGAVRGVVGRRRARERMEENNPYNAVWDVTDRWLSGRPENPAGNPTVLPKVTLAWQRIFDGAQPADGTPGTPIHDAEAGFVLIFIVRDQRWSMDEGVQSMIDERFYRENKRRFAESNPKRMSGMPGAREERYEHIVISENVRMQQSAHETVDSMHPAYNLDRSGWYDLIGFLANNGRESTILMERSRGRAPTSPGNPWSFRSVATLERAWEWVRRYVPAAHVGGGSELPTAWHPIGGGGGGGGGRGRLAAAAPPNAGRRRAMGAFQGGPHTPPPPPSATRIPANAWVIPEDLAPTWDDARRHRMYYRYFPWSQATVPRVNRTTHRLEMVSLERETAGRMDASGTHASTCAVPTLSDVLREHGLDMMDINDREMAQQILARVMSPHDGDWMHPALSMFRSQNGNPVCVLHQQNAETTGHMKESLMVLGCHEGESEEHRAWQGPYGIPWRASEAYSEDWRRYSDALAADFTDVYTSLQMPNGLRQACRWREEWAATHGGHLPPPVQPLVLRDGSMHMGYSTLMIQCASEDKEILGFTGDPDASHMLRISCYATFFMYPIMRMHVYRVGPHGVGKSAEYEISYGGYMLPGMWTKMDSFSPQALTTGETIYGPLLVDEAPEPLTGHNLRGAAADAQSSLKAILSSGQVSRSVCEYITTPTGQSVRRKINYRTLLMCSFMFGSNYEIREKPMYSRFLSLPKSMFLDEIAEIQARMATEKDAMTRQLAERVKFSNNWMCTTMTTMTALIDAGVLHEPVTLAVSSYGLKMMQNMRAMGAETDKNSRLMNIIKQICTVEAVRWAIVAGFMVPGGPCFMQEPTIENLRRVGSLLLYCPVEILMSNWPSICAQFENKTKGRLTKVMCALLLPAAKQELISKCATGLGLHLLMLGTRQFNPPRVTTEDNHESRVVEVDVTAAASGGDGFSGPTISAGVRVVSLVTSDACGGDEEEASRVAPDIFLGCHPDASGPGGSGRRGGLPGPPAAPPTLAAPPTPAAPPTLAAAPRTTTLPIPPPPPNRLPATHTFRSTTPAAAATTMNGIVHGMAQAAATAVHGVPSYDYNYIDTGMTIVELGAAICSMMINYGGVTRDQVNKFLDDMQEAIVTVPDCRLVKGDWDKLRERWTAGGQQRSAEHGILIDDWISSQMPDFNVRTRNIPLLIIGGRGKTASIAVSSLRSTMNGMYTSAIWSVIHAGMYVPPKIVTTAEHDIGRCFSSMVFPEEHVRRRSELHGPWKNRDTVNVSVEGARMMGAASAKTWVDYMEVDSGEGMDAPAAPPPLDPTHPEAIMMAMGRYFDDSYETCVEQDAFRASDCAPDDYLLPNGEPADLSDLAARVCWVQHGSPPGGPLTPHDLHRGYMAYMERVRAAHPAAYKKYTDLQVDYPAAAVHRHLAMRARLGAFHGADLLATRLACPWAFDEHGNLLVGNTSAQALTVPVGTENAGATMEDFARLANRPHLIDVRPGWTIGSQYVGEPEEEEEGAGRPRRARGRGRGGGGRGGGGRGGGGRGGGGRGRGRAGATGGRRTSDDHGAFPQPAAGHHHQAAAQPPPVTPEFPRQRGAVDAPVARPTGSLPSSLRRVVPRPPPMDD